MPLFVPFIAQLPIERIAEWRTFYRSSVTSLESSGSALRLQLKETDGALVAAADLSQREKKCCAFFQFAVTLGSDARWLVISVPDGAEETLSTFTEMLAAT